MRRKSLAVANRYLNRADTPERLAVNLATSTVVETGKPASDYIDRYRSRHGHEFSDGSSPERRKKRSP